MRTGASSDREHDLEGTAGEQPRRAAVARGFAHQRERDREHLRQEQQCHRQAGQQQAAVRQAETGLGSRAAAHHHHRGRGQQEREPQRTRGVGHRAGEEQRAVHGADAACEQQAEVHQVAVAPATVATEFLEQVRRQFLVAARQVVRDPHAPAGAAHQRGLDEVVRHDRARQAARARQRREHAVLHERREADDRVVSPVVRLVELPVVQAGGEQGAVEAAGELLHAREQRVAADRARRGLDDAGVGTRFHHAHQRRQARAAHHAVGVQHHHVAVVRAPAPQEVVDVAALLLHAALAAAIEQAAEAVDLARHRLPRRQFGDAQVGIVAVAEHEEVEALELPGRGERLPGRAQAGEHAIDVLVADRHDDRGARIGRDRAVVRFRTEKRARDQVRIGLAQQAQEAHGRGPEAGRDPAEQQREQAEHAGLHEVGAAVRQQVGHRDRRRGRGTDDQREQGCAPARARAHEFRRVEAMLRRFDRRGFGAAAGERVERAPRTRRQRRTREGRHGNRGRSLAGVALARDTRRLDAERRAAARRGPPRFLAERGPLRFFAQRGPPRWRLQPVVRGPARRGRHDRNLDRLRAGQLAVRRSGRLPRGRGSARMQGVERRGRRATAARSRRRCPRPGRSLGGKQIAPCLTQGVRAVAQESAQFDRLVGIAAPNAQVHAPARR